MFAQYTGGVIVGVFGAPQPDARDDRGNIICPGVVTVPIADDHPDVLEFFATPPAPPQDTALLLVSRIIGDPAALASLRVALAR